MVIINTSCIHSYDMAVEAYALRIYFHFTIIRAFLLIPMYNPKHLISSVTLILYGSLNCNRTLPKELKGRRENGDGYSYFGGEE